MRLRERTNNNVTMKGILIDNEKGDVLVERGRVAVGETEGQTAEVVLVTMRGELKEHPLLGGEAQKLEGGNGERMWAAEVRAMLRGCGVECERVRTENGVIRIER